MSVDVVVFTCAKYAPLIPKFLTMFERTFPLPYQLIYVVAGTNRVTVPRNYNREVTKFITMRDNDLASNMLDYLADKAEPFLMLMDDFMLFEANKDLLLRAWEIIHDPYHGCVRLVPWPGPTIKWDWPEFGEIDKSLEYAISLQASFWRPQTFRDLLDRSWSPWQIELEGSKRAASFHGEGAYPKRFIGCKTCAVNYKDYMMRGNRRPEHADWVDANI
jgi:hypothetical protein